MKHESIQVIGRTERAVKERFSVLKKEAAAATTEVSAVGAPATPKKPANGNSFGSFKYNLLNIIYST